MKINFWAALRYLNYFLNGIAIVAVSAAVAASILFFLFVLIGFPILYLFYGKLEYIVVPSICWGAFLFPLLAQHLKGKSWIISIKEKMKQPFIQKREYDERF